MLATSCCMTIFFWKYPLLVAIFALSSFSASAYEMPSACQGQSAFSQKLSAPELQIRSEICSALLEGQTRELFLDESTANPTYLNVLQYFSIDTFALMSRGRKKLSDVPSIEYALKATEEIVSRREKIDLNQIKNVDDFLKAASTLLGRKINFRHYDVVMSSNLASDDPQIMTIDSATYDLIKKNPFLYTYNKQPQTDLNKVRLSISYLYIGKIQKMLRQKTIVLDEEITKTLLDMDPNAGDYKLEKEKKAYEIALKEFISKLFTNEESLPPFKLYQHFMAIHPFHDGNGRSGRLFYEWIRLKQLGEQHKVGLPLYDMDLLSARSAREQLAAGTAVQIWVAQAKTNDEFLKRSDMGLIALMDIFPELKTTFPELL